MKSNSFLIAIIFSTIVVFGKANEQGLAEQSDINIAVIDSSKQTNGIISNNFEVKYFVKQLDNTNGLSNSSVNTIFQDSENLLWIGTWDGLNRYDGNNFKIFRPELNNKNSLSNQVILDIDEGIDGSIWVLTIHGINRYDKKLDTFQRFYFSRENTPPLSESEFNIALDKSKNVFCAVKGWGIGYYDGTIFKAFANEAVPSLAVKKLEFYGDGKLLVLYENNDLYVFEINTDSDSSKHISAIKLLYGNIKDFSIVPNQSIYAFFRSGQTKLISLFNKQTEITLSNNIQSILGYTADGIFISVKATYFFIDNFGDFIEKPWISQLKNLKITTLKQGSENVIWVGTDGDGLLKIYPLKKSFNLITKKQVPELEGSIVRSFAESQKSLWVGTKGKGLFRFDSGFYENQDKLPSYQVFNESNSSINNAVFALFKGKEDLIFIGSDGDGINIYDLRQSKLISWSEVIGNERCDYFKSVYTIYEDKSGMIYLGTNGYGMIRLKLIRKGQRLKVSRFKRYIAESNDGSCLSSNIIFSIVPKNSDELWIGTRLGGLNLFNKENEKFEIFKNDTNNPQSLSNNDILTLHKDKNDRLWIGTSFGLNALKDLDANIAICDNYTVKDGLPNNTIHGIVSDKDNNLWISTNFGLSNFIVENGKFINYSISEGLQNNEFADGALYKSIYSNYIFAGGIKGFNFFLPAKVEESSVFPDLFINKISGQNKIEPYIQSLLISSKSKIKESIELTHDQNFLYVELTALTFINSEKNQYAYKLSNLDQDWNEIQNRNNFSFNNLQAGNYTLWLKWSNSDGVWTEPVKAILIKIKPIFWQSHFAYVIYSLLLLLLLIFVISYYKKQNTLRQNLIFQKREEEIHQNRLTFFTDIAHEFQTPLTLIVGPVQKLLESGDFNEKSTKLITMIQRNSSRLFFLIQQLLEFRKAEYDYLEVSVQPFDLTNLVEQITELFDEWAIERKIDYSLDLDPKLEGWFDKDKIEKIIFNLLTNAFKFTPPAGKIKVHFSIQDRETKLLKIQVSNSGKGIPKEKLNALFDRFFLTDSVKKSDNNMYRTGIGLSYIKKLITALRGQIELSSKANKKTIFTILIPCDISSFAENEVNNDKGQILISDHLRNILGDNIPNIKGKDPTKIETLETILDSRKVILIVEDEEEIILFLSALCGDKYKIIIATNGIEALKIINQELPDIIISDVMMPKMDGIELCKTVKKDHKTCHIPVILLTAKNSIQHRIEGLESGANSYIAKPFYPEHLLVSVENLLEEKELLMKHLAKDSFLENLTNLTLENNEKKLLKEVIELIKSNIDNENLQSSFIEQKLGLSSSNLYRKVKQISGFSPGDLIRTIRLKYAADLLINSNLTVTEVFYKSGFNNRSYFYREFKKMYKTTPKNYQLRK